ncbi:hypothetical protein SAMN04488034_10113 [Salinimicrobium catena]|uniref:Uncharacterized protein n=1 Tax=Salinimicrobium catena TaxID=390640 RepID=A0A1H5GVJ0_9FLAO|nr:hypothetical protein [Salinimicrobium catena]SDK66026.1 hypothetical protein SAMN04488140_10113 [Salinimicrobium catena]SEE19743.1 hypothetical protein SAMN04488034_10113 [Salinimicrobium catena]
MDLQKRKIEFVQEFLKLQSEEVITRLEELLRKETNSLVQENSKPMTKEELNERIDISEADFQNNRFKRSSDLLKKYQ